MTFWSIATPIITAIVGLIGGWAGGATLTIRLKPTFRISYRRHTPP